MKFIKVIALLLVLYISPMAVVAEELKLTADGKGQVILDKEVSKDGNEYILNEAQTGETFNVMLTNAVSFTQAEYTEGYFDDPKNAGKFTFSKADNEMIIDNDLTTINARSSGYTFDINFTEPVDIESYYVGNALDLDLTFYRGTTDLGGQKPTGSSSRESGYKSKSFEGVTKITFRFPLFSRIAEFEIFENQKIEYIATSNIKVAAKDTSATLNYANPDSDFFRYNQILLDGQEYTAKTTDTTVEFEGLNPETSYEVIIRSYYKDGKYIDAISSFKTTKDLKPPGTVKSLTAKQVGGTVELKWGAPDDKDLSHYRISRNGILLESNLKDTTYTDAEPRQNSENTYFVIAVDKANNFSVGTSVKLKVIGTEVFNLQAKAASHEKVDLSWKNPQRDELETVRIARKDPNGGIAAKIVSFFTGDDGYNDLFQTNGTIFTDLTVSADTQYTYRLRTVIDGKESAGVTVNVKTPKVTAGGGGVTVDPDDTANPDAPKNYTITWTSPTTGKMKILVGGKEYKTVPAADKKIVIPKADMKYDLIGKPDVKLVPIGDDGTEGVPSSPGGGTSGGGGLGDIVGGGAVNAILNANNLIKAGVALLGVIGGFVLLGLSFRLVPKLIHMIRTAYAAKAERGINR